MTHLIVLITPPLKQTILVKRKRYVKSVWLQTYQTAKPIYQCIGKTIQTENLK